VCATTSSPSGTFRFRSLTVDDLYALSDVLTERAFAVRRLRGCSLCLHQSRRPDGDGCNLAACLKRRMLIPFQFQKLKATLLSTEIWLAAESHVPFGGNHTSCAQVPRKTDHHLMHVQMAAVLKRLPQPIKASLLYWRNGGTGRPGQKISAMVFPQCHEIEEVPREPRVVPTLQCRSDARDRGFAKLNQPRRRPNHVSCRRTRKGVGFARSY